MRIYGLIGRSLDHSWSEEYFRQKFLKEEIHDCVYWNIPLQNINGLPDVIRNFQDMAGLNITNPYKVEVLGFLDELSKLAASIGAVNCIKIARQGNDVQLKGFNTDAIAFRETLKPMLMEYHRNALVLGTGGAARAVCQALQELKLGYKLVSRKKMPGYLTYTDLNAQIIAGHQLIINASPAGMYPEAEDLPMIPYGAITPGHLLYDLIYNPQETLFLQKGAEAGAQIMNGLKMLHLQAELSWAIWNNS